MSSFTSAESAIEALYVGYFGRAADPAGMTYWLGQYTSGALTLAQVAASFSVQAESKALYPFLANPLLDDANHDNAAAFINSVFMDLFNHGETAASDPAGFAYWLAQTVAGASNPQLIGQMIENIISGAPAGSADDLTLQNKVSVGDTFTTDFATNNSAYNATAAALAHTVIAGTTSTSTTVTTQDAAIAAYLSGATTAGTTFVLTTGIDVINSTSAGDVVIGTLAPSGASTLNPGDSLSMAGGKLEVVDTLTTVTSNELAGLLVSGPFVFQVQDVATADAFDFAALSTVTKVISSNSLVSTTFTSLPTGTVVEASGAATAAGANISFKMASPSAAVSVQFDSGVNGVTIANTTSGAAETTGTVASTGAANGSASHPDFYVLTTSGAGTLTSETFNAATNYTGGFENADWKGFGAANTDTLTIQGAAASVNVTFSSTVVGENTVNASGLTAGGLTAVFNGFVTSFTGGAGNDVIFLNADPGATANFNEGAGNNMLLETGAFGPLPIGMVANGGSATGVNVISAQLLSAGDAANITNFTLMDLGFAAATTYDASLEAGSAFTGVTYTSGTGGVGQAATASGAAIVTGLLGTAETLSVTGTTASFDETHQIKISQANAATATAATGDTMAISFANNDAAGATTEFTGAGAGIVTSHIVTASINAGTTVTGGGAGTETDLLNQLADSANLLTTVSITGTANVSFGAGGNAVATDTGASASVLGTQIASSLTLIDGSAATGNLTIEAGGNTQSTANGPNLTITYTGLTIKGGTHVDSITNDAASGVIVLGNGGTSTAAFTTGTVTSQAETVTFGTGFDQATIQNGHFSAGFLAGSAFETQTVNGTLTTAHDVINVSAITGAAAGITNYSANAGVTGATSLANAEAFVAGAVGNSGTGYFTWAPTGNEYIVATSATEATFGTDVVVQLTGGAFAHNTIALGVITLVT